MKTITNNFFESYNFYINSNINSNIMTTNMGIEGCLVVVSCNFLIMAMMIYVIPYAIIFADISSFKPDFQMPNQIIDTNDGAFNTSYDFVKGPNWASYKIIPTSKRCYRNYYKSTIYSKTKSSYENLTYEMGLLVPDNVVVSPCSVYTMTNVFPQITIHKRYIWNEFEEFIKETFDFAVGCVVYTVPIYESEYVIDGDGNKMYIPKKLCKVITCREMTIFSKCIEHSEIISRMKFYDVWTDWKL